MTGSRAVRLLWLWGGSAFAVAVLGFTTVQVVSALAHEERTVVLAFESPVAVVDVAVERGSVRVVGTTSTTTTVTATVSDGLRATQHTEELVGDRLRLRAGCPLLLSDFCRVDYLVEAPAGVAVEAASDHGRVTVTDVRGGVSLSSDNGTLEADRISGPTSLRTDNGAIVGTNLAAEVVEAATDNGSVRLAFTTAPREVRARSDNGAIEVVVPDTPVTYQVDLDSDRGSMSSPIRTDPTSPRVIAARTQNGSITVRYPTS